MLRLNRKHKAFEQQLFRNSLAILDWYHNMVLGISLTFDLKINTLLPEIRPKFVNTRSAPVAWELNGQSKRNQAEVHTRVNLDSSLRRSSFRNSASTIVFLLAGGRMLKKWPFLL